MLIEYLLRSTVKGPYGYALSSGKQHISGDAMHYSLVRIGRILGWESNATAYTLRYAAGNSMNQNGEAEGLSSITGLRICADLPNSEYQPGAPKQHHGTCSQFGHLTEKLPQSEHHLYVLFLSRQAFSAHTENIEVDLWALQRGFEPQIDIMRNVTSFGHNRSPRRPWN